MTQDTPSDEPPKKWIPPSELKKAFRAGAAQQADTVDRLVKENDELKAEVERLLKELDRQGRVLAERDDEIEELAEQRDLARAEVERLRGELEQLHDEHEVLLARLALKMDGGGEGK